MKRLSLLILTLLFVFSCKKDDEVTTIPVCSVPENIAVSSITNASALITWENANETHKTFIEYGVSGFATGNGTTISSIEFSETLSNLQPSTKYDVYLKAICSDSNESFYSEKISFTTLEPFAKPQFFEKLSDLNVYSGLLSLMRPTSYAIDYKPNSELFTDYAHKQRFIILPQGEAMQYNNDGGLLPTFPDNTIIVKTFFYYLNETNPVLGKKIIETRVLIKQNGAWDFGSYRWNTAQTEAFLDTETAPVQVNYVNEQGEEKTVNYVIPSYENCNTCHNNAGNKTPIGLKLKSLNYNNLLQDIIDNGHLSGLTDASTIETIPDYKDETVDLESRARAYFDINCAHCHIEGGFCATQTPIRLSYDTSLSESKIYENRFSIKARMQYYIPGFTMPFIGTTMLHPEGFEIIEEYLDSL